MKWTRNPELGAVLVFVFIIAVMVGIAIRQDLGR